tara:strand:- start:1395 stop:2243 length:849 start_codon:yes stop_codon:yes gene_type:complete
MSGNKKNIVAFNYLGAKNAWLNYLYPHFPMHDHFVDVFGGSASVSLNKSKSKIETFNDINKDVVNFFNVLRDFPKELLAQLALTPYSRAEFQNSWPIYDDDPIIWARKFYTRSRQSFAGLGTQKRGKGWLMAKMSGRSDLPEGVGKWRNGWESLIQVADRLSEFQIECRDFRKLIPAIDYKEAFFYLDPPYLLESRNCPSGSDYKHDLKNNDHIDLADLIKTIEGKAAISGYDSPFMHELYSDWFFVKFPIKRNNIRFNPVQECLWMNYDSSIGLKQKSLFN